MPDVTQQPWKPLPFREAIDFFQSRVPLTEAQARKLEATATERAFVVGGLAAEDLVTDVLDGIQKAIASGTTIDQFRKDIAQVIAEKGWTGVKDWRVQTIFRTSVQQAYNAGKWTQFEEGGDDLSIAVYDAVGDSRTRPSHLALDGKAFAKNDPIWLKWWPPNGFNCRCTVRLMSAAEARARGVKVESGEGIARGEPVSMGPGRDQVIAPDPGFGGNPGRDFLRGIAGDERTDRGFRPLKGLRGPAAFGLPDSVEGHYGAARTPWPGDRLLPEDTTPEEAARILRDALGFPAGATAAVKVDALGRPVVVPEWLLRQVDPRWARVLADVVGDPAEIWLTPGTNDAGDLVARRTYVQVFEDPGHKTKVSVAVAQVERGVMMDLSMRPAEEADALRQGHSLHAKVRYREG